MKNLKFGVDRANIELEIQRDVCMYCRTPRPDVYTGISQYILEFLNGCISFNIGPINTKLEDVANFNMLFLTI